MNLNWGPICHNCCRLKLLIAVDNIVSKKAGIVGKLKTAKQNLIGHDGETTDSQFKPVSVSIH